jgi:hypothetical protein
MPLRHYHAGRAEGCRGAQNRPDILRVGHLVEDDENAFGPQIVDLDGGQGRRLEHYPLMHCLGADHPVELSWYRSLGCNASGLQGVIKTPRGIFGREQPADDALRVGECGLDGVQAVKQDALSLA